MDKATRQAEEVLNANPVVQEMLRERSPRHRAIAQARWDRELGIVNAPMLRRIHQPKSLPGQLGLFE